MSSMQARRRLRLRATLAAITLLLTSTVAATSTAAAAASTGTATNGLIVYALDGDLWTVTPDGTYQTNLTQTPDSYEGTPRWSPDGQQLAFSARLEPCSDDCRNQLWVMDADGSQRRQVTTGAHAATFPTWSPDSTKLAYASNYGGQDIYVINVDGTGDQRLTFDTTSTAPSWSPDGTRIAFHANPTYSNVDIFTVHPDGTGRTQVTTDPKRDFFPAFSPDGSKIAFASDRVCNPYCYEHIWVMNADGSGATEITQGKYDSSAAWSPDGQQVVYRDGLSGSGGINTVNVDGTGVQQVVFTSGNGFSPHWQPVRAVGDSDGDGIYDNVDMEPATVSTGFSDGATSGNLASNLSGLTVTITDAPTAEDGVRVAVGAGSGSVTLSVCGFSIRLAAGSDSILTCGSVRISVTTGHAEVVLGTTIVSIPEGGSGTVDENADGSYSVVNSGPTPITVSVDGTTATVESGATLATLRSWQFEGFTAPVDNLPTLNVLKAGQTVPLRWRLLTSDGAPVTTLSTAKLSVTNVACNSSTGSDAVEEIVTANSGLLDLGDGYYQMNWSTPKSFAGTCKRLHLDIGDGVTHDALFSLTR